MHGCGFQLRVAQLSQYVDNIAIEGNVHPETRAAIERRLFEEGLSTDDGHDANLILRLTDERLRQRATLFGSDGRATEYELTLKIDTQLERSDSANPVRNQSFSASGRYGIDSSMPMASVAEREVLERQMRDRLAQQLSSFLLNALRTAGCETATDEAACIETERK